MDGENQDVNMENGDFFNAGRCNVGGRRDRDR